MDNREKNEPAQAESGQSCTVSEFLALIEPRYRVYEDTMRRCISGMISYAGQLAAQGQEGQLPQFLRLCIEMDNFWGLTEDLTPEGCQEMEQRYTMAFDRVVSEARAVGRTPDVTDQTRKNILAGLKLYAKEMRYTDSELEKWAVECDILAETLKKQWQAVDASPQPEQRGMEMGEMSL